MGVGAARCPAVGEQAGELDGAVVALDVDEVIAVDRGGICPIGHMDRQLWMREDLTADQFAGVVGGSFEIVAA